MSYFYFLNLEVCYKKAGIISTAATTENKRIHIDPETIPAAEYKDYYIPETIKALKKAMQLYKKDNYFDIEITVFHEAGYNNDRIYLIHQDYKNRDNDTLTLYDYTDKSDLQAQINVMSYPAIIKTLTAAIENIIMSYFQEVKSA